LVQARNLRAIEGDASAARAEAAVERLLSFWETDLRQHFRDEEEILLPAFARYAGVGRPELSRTLLEHVDIRGMIAGLAESLRNESSPGVSLLNRLGDLLHDHIRFEENVLFPAVEESVPEEELIRIGRAIEASRAK
jgi:iron-sulfur cluster repair protein YtfE (RIC family)